MENKKQSDIDFYRSRGAIPKRRFQDEMKENKENVSDNAPPKDKIQEHVSQDEKSSVISEEVKERADVNTQVTSHQITKQTYQVQRHKNRKKVIEKQKALDRIVEHRRIIWKNERMIKLEDPNSFRNRAISPCEVLKDCGIPLKVGPTDDVDYLPIGGYALRGPEYATLYLDKKYTEDDPLFMNYPVIPIKIENHILQYSEIMRKKEQKFEEAREKLRRNPSYIILMEKEMKKLNIEVPPSSEKCEEKVTEL